jgi:nitrogen regulatory protein PII
MSEYFRTLHKVSVVAAILPPPAARPVIERLFASGERNAFVTNARGTLIRDQWIQRFMPLISPEKEILRFIVPDAQVDGVIRDITEAGGLRYPGSGAVYSVPCDTLAHTPDFPVWAGLDGEENGVDASIGLRENLSLISCIVQPEQTETISRAAMQAGAHGPVVFYCEGRGLRDRLGWLRITKKRTKEVMTLIVDNADTDAVVEAITVAGRLEMPGRGYLYCMPVHKGMVHLASTVGGRHHAADMQQIVSAIDELMGHSDWRRRQVVRLGGGGRAAGLHLDPAEQADPLPVPHMRLTFISGQAHTQTLLDTALAAGASGANVMSARFVEVESRVAMGRRLNRERNWVQTVMPRAQAEQVMHAVMQRVETEGISETCLFAQPVSRTVTYRAQFHAEPDAATGLSYRGARVTR